MSERSSAPPNLAASLPPSLSTPGWKGGPCLELVREFNEGFLELLSHTARLDGARALPEFVRVHRGAWLALDAAARARAAQCPFLLADIHYRNPAWWQWASGKGIRPPRTTGPPGLFSSKLAVEVMYEALVLTWHTTRLNPRVAATLFGISSQVCEIVASLGLRDLRHLASHHHRSLRPRWEHLASFWGPLLSASSRENPQSLHDLFRHGIQLLDHE